MERQLLRFLNDQRFRWVSSLILLLGFFIGSLQDVNYKFSIEVLEGMFPAFLYACIFLIPVYRRRKLYKLIYNRALRICGSKRKVFFYILLGLHGKLLGINIAHKNKFKCVNVNIRMYNFDDVQCTVIPSVAYGFVTGMNLQLC